MNFVVEYAKPVAGEVQEVLDWYKEKSYSASLNFLLQLNIAEKSIQKNPFAYRIVSNQGIRRIVLKKFPYRVYFSVDVHYLHSCRYTFFPV